MKGMAITGGDYLQIKQVLADLCHKGDSRHHLSDSRRVPDKISRWTDSFCQLKRLERTAMNSVYFTRWWCGQKQAFPVYRPSNKGYCLARVIIIWSIQAPQPGSLLCIVQSPYVVAIFLGERVNESGAMWRDQTMQIWMIKPLLVEQWSGHLRGGWCSLTECQPCSKANPAVNQQLSVNWCKNKSSLFVPYWVWTSHFSQPSQFSQCSCFPKGHKLWCHPD